MPFERQVFEFPASFNYGGGPEPDAEQVREFDDAVVALLAWRPECKELIRDAITDTLRGMFPGFDEYERLREQHPPFAERW